jgi:hypothetical protein
MINEVERTDVKRVACRLSRPSSRFAFGERNAPNGGCGGLARLRAARARGRALLKPLRSDLKARGVRFCAGTSALKRGGTRPLHRLGTQSERERPDRHRTTRLSPNSRPGAPPCILSSPRPTTTSHLSHDGQTTTSQTTSQTTDPCTDHTDFSPATSQALHASKRGRPPLLEPSAPGTAPQ